MGTLLVHLHYSHQMDSIAVLLFLFNLLLSCHANIMSREGSENENSDDTSAIPSENQKFKEMFGFSIAQYVRREWEEVVLSGIMLGQNMKNSVLDVNPCVNSLKAYTIFLEQRVKLIEEYAPHIEDVILGVFSLRGVRNLTTLTLGGAEILSNLNILYPVFLTSFALEK